MKRKAKRILGSCGLLAVGLTTTFAAFLPSPITAAINSVTDTIQVRVVGSQPEVHIWGITNGEVVTKNDESFSVGYANAETVEVSLEYDNSLSRAFHVKTIDVIDADYNEGQKTYNVKLKNLIDDENLVRFGYGQYILNAVADGYEGAWDSDSLAFTYLPVKAEVEQSNDGTQHIILDYTQDDGTEENDGEVNRIEINIILDGEVIGTIEVPKGATDVEIPFDKYDLPSGTHEYEIEIVAYDRSEHELYRPYVEVTTEYTTIDIPTTGSPDTGFFTGNLGISKSDFMITGMIIFGVVVVAGVVFVTKGSKRK